MGIGRRPIAGFGSAPFERASGCGVARPCWSSLRIFHGYSLRNLRSGHCDAGELSVWCRDLRCGPLRRDWADPALVASEGFWGALSVNACLLSSIICPSSKLSKLTRFLLGQFMPTQIINSEREFQIWKYTVGHSQLLLRSTKAPNLPTRIDVLFKGVSEFHLPTALSGLSVQEASERSNQKALQFARITLVQSGR